MTNRIDEIKKRYEVSTPTLQDDIKFLLDEVQRKDLALELVCAALPLDYEYDDDKQYWLDKAREQLEGEK
jgi:hypothetical protein